MEAVSDLNEAKTLNEMPKEAPKKKRGRPKKARNVKDGFEQAKLEYLKKDTNESLMFTDQNEIKFLKYGDMVARPKRRGRPRKPKWRCPKKKLGEVNEQVLNHLCPAKVSFQENYNFCESHRMEVTSDIIAAKVDTVQTASTAENGVSTKEEELTKTFNEEFINTSHETESTKCSNGYVNVSDICASTRLPRCSVRLKRLEKDEIRQNQNYGTDDEDDITLKKDPLLENLGSFIRYKGSSTRGRFFNAHDYGDIASPHCFKFSDDSFDEDYIPEKEANENYNDDSDWIPSKKSTKRKSGKNTPLNNNNVKSVKRNEKCSTKLNHPLNDDSGTSVDNSFTGSSFYSSFFSGEIGLITTTDQNLDSIQTSGCASTDDLIRDSEKNLLSMERTSPGMMSESKNIQSSTVSILKRNHSELQESGTSTYHSKKTIEIIDLSIDSSSEDESAKTLTSMLITSDCPIKVEPTFPTLNACESLTVSNEPRKRTKSQALRNSSCSSNDSERAVNGSVGNRLKLSLEKQDHYLTTEINSSSCKRRKNFEQLVSHTTGHSSLHTVAKDAQLMTESFDNNVSAQIKHSKDEVSLISNSVANTFPTDTTEDSHSQTKGDPKHTNGNTRKRQSIREIQNTLQSILKQNIRPKRQESQGGGVTSNPLPDDSVSCNLQTVLQTQDSQLMTEVCIGKSSNVSQSEIIHTGDCALNASAELENTSHNSKLMRGLFAVEPPSKTKSRQPKKSKEKAECSVKHQELNGDVPLEGVGPIPNSSANRSEDNVEQSHAFDVSHIVHCSRISDNLNDEHCTEGCTYCTVFAELDAITILAAADFGADPKQFIECELESNEAMYEKLKVGRPQGGKGDLSLKRAEHRNRCLKYGRDYLSSFGSFTTMTEHFLK